MKFRDRVTELRRVRASDLTPNSRNWRDHSDGRQRAVLRGLLTEIGFAGAELCYFSERNGGALTLIDGQLRKEEAGAAEVPCLVTDLDDEEADKLLALLHPVAEMAGTDGAKLDALLKEIETDDEAIDQLLVDLASVVSQDEGQVELEEVDAHPPPVMAWVLVGIPILRFAEIAAAVEMIAEVPGVVCETTANNG